MASSSSIHLLIEDIKPVNWLDLPPELMSSVLVRLGAVEILLNAQRVCKAWRRISKNPSIWRKIDMRGFNHKDAQGVCYNAVTRNEGGLVEIKIGNFVNDSLLRFIAHRSSNLRSLGLEECIQVPEKELANAVAKFPFLEELEVLRLWSMLDLKVIGHFCPRIKTLKLNCICYPGSRYESNDEDALALAESMPELRHLQLIGNRLTNTGLNAILDNCPHLENLDLRMCMNFNLSGDLEKQCLERIKDFRRPNDSLADYPYYAVFYDTESNEDLDNASSDTKSNDDLDNVYDTVESDYDLDTNESEDDLGNVYDTESDDDFDNAVYDSGDYFSGDSEFNSD